MAAQVHEVVNIIAGGQLLRHHTSRPTARFPEFSQFILKSTVSSQSCQAEEPETTEPFAEQTYKYRFNLGSRVGETIVEWKPIDWDQSELTS